MVITKHDVPCRGADEIIIEDAHHIIKRLGNRVNAMDGARILVTGAGGYVASYFCDLLVLLNDLNFNGRSHFFFLIRKPPGKYTRLTHLMGRKDVTFIVQDVSYPLDQELRIDFIIHAASPASPVDYLAQPLSTVDANVWATRHLLELAIRWQSKSFLFLSTGSAGVGVVSGIAEKDLVAEDCLSPRSCYTMSKRMGETLCGIYWRECGVPVKIVRLYHTYGPGMRLDDGRVVPDFIRMRLKNIPIEALSDGTASRAFCYIADSVYGVFAAMLSNHHGEVFNIGTDRPTSVRNLAHMVAQLEDPILSVRLAVNQNAEHIQEAKAIDGWPNIDKAGKYLDFKPMTDLQVGLARTVRWYKRFLNTSEEHI